MLLGQPDSQKHDLFKEATRQTKNDGRLILLFVNWAFIHSHGLFCITQSYNKSLFSGVQSVFFVVSPVSVIQDRSEILETGWDQKPACFLHHSGSFSVNGDCSSIFALNRSHKSFHSLVIYAIINLICSYTCIVWDTRLLSFMLICCVNFGDWFAWKYIRQVSIKKAPLLLSSCPNVLSGHLIGYINGLWQWFRHPSFSCHQPW